jgi:hypothetical protein
VDNDDVIENSVAGRAGRAEGWASRAILWEQLNYSAEAGARKAPHVALRQKQLPKAIGGPLRIE